MNRLAILVVLNFVIGAIFAPSSQAQEVVPAARLLPSASELGDGWIMAKGGEELATAADGSFVSIASALYLGPSGSRARVGAYLVKEGSAAARDSWEVAGKYFDGLRYSADINFSGESGLASRPLVAGCADMRRGLGTDRVESVMSFAVDLCAADPGAIIVTYVSGQLGKLSGGDAADHLLELALAKRDIATPTTTG